MEKEKTKFKANLDFILSSQWSIKINNIYDINLLLHNEEYLQHNKITEDNDYFDWIKILYFTEDMLCIENTNKSVCIDVGQYGNLLAYTIIVIPKVDGLYNWDLPLEKITIYKFSDCKRFLLEFMAKYNSTITS